MAKAVCVQCGDPKSSWEQVCPGCGGRPEGDGLLVAWIASEHNLTASQLQSVSARIRAGEPFRPSKRMFGRARAALGQNLASDTGLSWRQRGGLLATSLLFTPLVGWTCFFWWRRERPRAAMQALALSLPFTVLFTGLWVVTILRGGL